MTAAGTAAKGGRTAAGNRRAGLAHEVGGAFVDADIVTDFADMRSNGQIATNLMYFYRTAMRARAAGVELPTLRWDDVRPVQTDFGFALLNNVDDVPGLNIDYAALSVGESAAPDKVVVHVTDPRVGNKNAAGAHQRSILDTDNHGVFVGPNNGSLGMLGRVLEAEREPYRLHEIDLDLVLALHGLIGRRALKSLPETFHGRDVFALVAGLIAGGVSPESLAAGQIGLAHSVFVDSIVPLLAHSGDSVEVLALRDNTQANLKLGVTIPEEEFFALEGMTVTVINPANAASLTAVVDRSFKDQPDQGAAFTLGSSWIGDERLLELIVNGGKAGERLGIDSENGAKALKIQKDWIY